MWRGGQGRPLIIIRLSKRDITEANLCSNREGYLYIIYSYLGHVSAESTIFWDRKELGGSSERWIFFSLKSAIQCEPLRNANQSPDFEASNIKTTTKSRLFDFNAFICVIYARSATQFFCPFIIISLCLNCQIRRIRRIHANILDSFTYHHELDFLNGHV